jgi:malate/lactate dehydrogenase
VCSRAKGVERIIGFKMDETEQKFMSESVSHVKDLLGVVWKLFPEVK